MDTWLVKQEPTKYSWEQFLKDKTTYWDGVRNYQARNNLKAMRAKDQVLFYHSVIGKQVMGVAEVTREAYQDPTTDDDRWVVVDLKPLYTLKIPVTLEAIKANKELSELPLIKQSRLSVMPVPKNMFQIIIKMGGGAQG